MKLKIVDRKRQIGKGLIKVRKMIGVKPIGFKISIHRYEFRFYKYVVLLFLLLPILSFAQNGFVHPNGNIELTPARATEIRVSYQALEQRFKKCEEYANGLNAIITDQASFMVKAADSITHYKGLYDNLQHAEVREVSKGKKWSIGAGIGAGTSYHVEQSRVKVTIQPVIFMGVMRNLWSF